MIQSNGLFWRPDHVYWGAGSYSGKLLGIPANCRSDNPTDFREQAGIYVLYSEFRPIYVGQTGSGSQKLLVRRRQHRSDDLAERWDRFSWFGLRRVLGNNQLSRENRAAHPEIALVLNHIEAILIHAIEPPLNRQGGRFGESVTRFLQVRDERLGKSVEDMVKEVYERGD